MVYKGSGGPPPSSVSSSPKGKSNFFGLSLFEDLPSKKTKKIGLFRVEPGDNNVPFLFLDEALPSAEAAPSIRVHDGFKYNGKYGNFVICVQHRPGGCLLDKALEREHECASWCEPNCDKRGKNFPQRGSWRWVATGIKMKPYTIKGGKRAGDVIPYQRCMLLVPDKQYRVFMAFRDRFKDEGGLRGKIFNVSRPDKKSSPKIGDVWIPAGEMTDEEMMEKFEESANTYGMPVEHYIRPYNYEKVLKELTDQEMDALAREVAAENNVSLTGVVEDEDADSSHATDGDDEADDDSVPF